MSSIYKWGKIYWYQYSTNNKLHSQSLKTGNWGVAESLQRKFDKTRKQRKPRPGSNQNIQYWVDVYLDWLEPSVGVDHHRHCKTRLNKFVTHCGKISPESVTVETVQNFLDNLPHGGRTKNYYKGAIVKCFKFCKNKGLDVDIQAASTAMTPKSKPQPPRFLTPKQEREILRLAYHCDNDLYFKIIVAIRTGMRLRELRRMQWDHINYGQNTIFIPKTKTCKQRSIPLHKTLRKRFLRRKQKTGLVFAGATRTWGKELEKVRTPIFTQGMSQKATGRGWHLFRHTFASRLVQAGVDIFKISKWLGHASISTTMIYAHLAPRNYDSDIDRL